MSPRFAGTLFDVFPGGCVTYAFDFARGRHITLTDDCGRQLELLDMTATPLMLSWLASSASVMRTNHHVASSVSTWMTSPGFAMLRSIVWNGCVAQSSLRVVELLLMVLQSSESE